MKTTDKLEELAEKTLQELKSLAAPPAEPLENGLSGEEVMNRFYSNLIRTSWEGEAAARLIALECEGDDEYRETITALEYRGRRI